jgi:glutamine synthetase type III
MFLQEGPHGTSILYVPSVFISYNGQALDEKTVLLRSSEVLAKNALDVLDLIFDPENGKRYGTTLFFFLYFFFFWYGGPRLAERRASAIIKVTKQLTSYF